MSRRCDLTGKAAQTGHKVSHSNRKTKRRFLPNLCSVTFISDARNRSVRLRGSANALKSVDHRDGLDAFLMKAKDEELSREADEAAIWDWRLNAAWARLKAALPGPAFERLQIAQRGWLAYRDHECRDDGTGGTAGRLAAASCLVRVTAIRAGELEARAAGR